MSDSGIIAQVLNMEKCSRKAATHFVLCNGEKIRYLISLQGGAKRLSGNISAYSKKMEMLLNGMDMLPVGIFKLVHLGYFAKVTLHPAVENARLKTDKKNWNAIVGTYDEKQKIVLQCFNKDGPAVFMKIGNTATQKEMLAEIRFLQERHDYVSFRVPELISAKLRDEVCPFNIQVTKEFSGDKTEPVLTEDIVAIYRELSQKKKIVDGKELELSHGDFAPWNIKKQQEGYVVFDWEHCGYRMCGYDLMHFVTMVEVVMGHSAFEEGFDKGLIKIRKFIPEYRICKSEFLDELRKTIKQLT